MAWSDSRLGMAEVVMHEERNTYERSEEPTTQFDGKICNQCGH